MLYHYIRMNGSLPVSALARSRASANGEPADGRPADAGHLIELFRTLADPIRLRIVRLLESGPQPGGGGGGDGAGTEGGLSVGELAEILKLPQSTVSRHLKTLTEGALAEARRDGTSTFYRVCERSANDASRLLRQLARAHLEHDALARTDGHRLASVLRKREPAGDAFFGKHAPRWDQLRAQWFGDTFHLEGLLALLDPTWVVADIGTGTGALLPLLAPHVRQMIAVDPSAAMLRGARNRVRELGLENVDICQGAAEHLPFESGSIDVALLALVLAYTSDPAAVLKEIRRVLRPGGLVLIMDLQPHGVELFRQKLNHRWMGFSQENLASWLEGAGFSNIRWHPLSPRKGRARESGGKGRGRGATPIPDLFALRAQATNRH